jgi:hypothetical protein
MSKVVKKVGRAVGKIVKGVGKAVKGVVNGVKKFAKSKIGKIILAAATIYFGGAAIMGAMGGVGASTATGFMANVAPALKGAAAGIGNAWTGLTTAATGGGFGGMSGVFTGGASGAGASAVSGAAGSGLVQGAITNGMTQSQMLAAQNAGLSGATKATQAALQGALPGAAPAASAGWFSSMSPLAQHATISAGSQLAGGLIQGVGAQKAADEERKYAEQQAAQRSANVGAPIIGSVADRAMQPRSPVRFDDYYERIGGSPLGVSNGGLIQLARG